MKDNDTALERLNTRLLVAEAALDAIFSAAATVPSVQAALSAMFETNLAGLRAGLAETGRLETRQGLETAAQTLRAALQPASEPPAA